MDRGEGMRPEVGFCGDEVGRGDDMLVAVGFSNPPALVPFSTYDEDVFVFQRRLGWVYTVYLVDKAGKRGMALNEFFQGYRHRKKLAQFADPLRFCFSSAIGEEDKRDGASLEMGKGLGGSGEWSGGAEENAINTGRLVSFLISSFLIKIKDCYSKAKAKSGAEFDTSEDVCRDRWICGEIVGEGSHGGQRIVGLDNEGGRKFHERILTAITTYTPTSPTTHSVSASLLASIS
ncbi:MAG: hypothetical protein Q9214_002970 [Letrouitia sp. 1 TL-2023]